MKHRIPKKYFKAHKLVTRAIESISQSDECQPMNYKPCIRSTRIFYSEITKKGNRGIM